MAASHDNTRLVVDCLLDLYSAYESLEILSGLSHADSQQVAFVLRILNEDLLRRIEDVKSLGSGSGAGLRVVRDEL